MKLGLDTYSYHYAAGLWDYTPRENTPMTVLHFLRKASELGLDGVHLCDPRHLDSLEYGYVTSLKEKADTLNLYLELGTEGTNPDHLQNMVRAAHVLGSPLVRTSLGRSRPITMTGMDALLAEAASEIEQVASVCERYQVALALESHRELATREVLHLLELVGSEWVGVCLNTGAPLALLEDPLESAQMLALALKSVRLADHRVAATSEGFALIGCALGEGVVGLTEILDVLSAQAPGVPVNICTPVEKRLLPVLDEGYLRHLPAATAHDLGRTLRLVRDRGEARMPRLPVEEGASEDEILADEDEFVLRSVRWAQRALGRSELELPESGG